MRRNKEIISKYNELVSNYINATSEEVSLKYENAITLYVFIPLFIFIALFNLVFYPFFGADLKMILITSAALLFIILILIFVKKYLKSERMKSRIIISVFTLYLVFLFAHYYDFINDVVWVLVAIFVVIAMGRKDNKLLIGITIDAVILSVYVLLRYPEANAMHVFVSRCLAFCGLFFIIAMIKKIHSRRVGMISSQLKQSQIIAQMSSEMISVSQENFESKIESFLDVFGNLFNMDRVRIMKLSSDRLSLIHKFEWVAPGIERNAEKVKSIDMQLNYWWNEQLESREIFVISDVDALDPEKSRGKEILRSSNIRSLISIPIIMNDAFFGFLIVSCINKRETWRNDEKRMMTVLANILGDAYHKIEKEEEIMHMAYYDALTGLPNRLLFKEKLCDYIENNKTNPNKLAVLFLDLNSFKSVNDTMGHESGDALLVQIGKKLKQMLTMQEFVARFGGDEFVVIIRYQDDDELIGCVQKIRAVLNRPFSVNKQDLYVTASAGIALYPVDGEDWQALVRNADLAMYEAKQLGRNQYVFCSSAMKEAVAKQVYLTNKLNKALENDEFVLHYQPQICVTTRKIVGVEALIRWDSPELGMISPGIFIPLSEQSGMIHDIGKWVLKTALKQNKMWMDMGLGPIRMAVNLSIEQFRNPGFVQIVRNAIQETGVNAEYVELEVTESIAIKKAYSVVPTLKELKALGLTISIDDFGTMYSSLLRIKTLPVDRIKMAMEFVQGITVSEKDEAIAILIITLANSLGLKVIAEGVETIEQLNFLEQKICDEVQGFYFYKPMPAEEVEKILLEQTMRVKTF